VPMPVPTTVKVRIHGGNDGGSGSSKSKSYRNLGIASVAGGEESRDKRVLGAPPMLALSPDGTFSQKNPLHKLRAAALATAGNKSATAVALTAFASPAMKANILKAKSLATTSAATANAHANDEEEDPATVRTNPSPQALEGAGIALPGVADAPENNGTPVSKKVGMAKFKNVANTVRLSSRLNKPTGTAAAPQSPSPVTPTSSTAPSPASSGLRSGVNNRDFVLQKPRSVAPQELALRADEPEVSTPLRSLRSPSRDFAVSSRLLAVSRSKTKTPVSPSPEVSAETPLATSPQSTPVEEAASPKTTPKLKRFANAVKLAGKFSKAATPAAPIAVASPLPKPESDAVARASIGSAASRLSVARPRSVMPAQIAARRDDDEPRASLSSLRSGSREFAVSTRMLAIPRSKPAVTPVSVGNPIFQTARGSSPSSSP
jgi:hypothetical protein